MKTEIYGTIGPACEKEETLRAMFQAGMRGMRINLSHCGLKDCGTWIESIVKASQGKSKLLIDLKGPELRIGDCEERMLVKDDFVWLNSFHSTHRCGSEIPVPELVMPFLKQNQELLLDDGKLLLLVEGIESEDRVCCRVIRGGSLKPGKSMALPGTDIYPPTLTDSDVENIALIKKYHITGVMLPFVRGLEDINNLRLALLEAGAEGTEIFAKIENRQGVLALPELLTAADCIVIARGDLGNAIPLWELPVVQNKIAIQCRKAQKPFMVVTQMLASMEEKPVPTRAEMSDIFHAVMQGAAAVMLTGETAAGRYPVDAMDYMCRTVEAAEEYRSTL